MRLEAIHLEDISQLEETLTDQELRGVKVKWTQGGEASASAQCQSRNKKGHMMKIYLSDSDEEAIVDFVKDHKEIYDKTMRTLRTMPGRIACVKAAPTPVKVWKTWFESKRTCYIKLTQCKPGQAPKEMTERQN